MFTYRAINRNLSCLDKYRKRVIGYTDKSIISTPFNLITVYTFNYVDGRGPVDTFNTESDTWEHWETTILLSIEMCDLWVVERTFPALKTLHNGTHYIWHRYALLPSINTKWS